jgi:hypothetical protein
MDAAGPGRQGVVWRGTQALTCLFTLPGTSEHQLLPAEQRPQAKEAQETAKE